MRIRRRLTIVAILVSAAGCHRALHGTYKDKTGAVAYHFKSDGKMEIITDVFGMQQVAEVPYRYEDGKLKITGQGITQVLSFDSDGCIDAVVSRLCPAP